MNEPEIIQIIPAPAGMSAVYKDTDGKFGTPIVALALVEEDGFRYVVPMDMDDFGEVDIVTPDGTNFCGMLFNGDHIRKKEEPVDVDLNDPEALRRAYEADERQKNRYLFGLE